MKLDSAIVSNDVSLIYLYDGVPILNGDEVMDFVDPDAINSICLHKRPVYNCENIKLFDSLLEIESNDTINTGLKYILTHTENWIFYNPLANLYLDDEKTGWDYGFEQLLLLGPSSILKIEVMEPDDTGECDNGKIYITTK